MKRVKVILSTKAELMDDGKSKLARVIRGDNGQQVEIPINKDGSIKWYDDKQLIRKK